MYVGKYIYIYRYKDTYMVYISTRSMARTPVDVSAAYPAFPRDDEAWLAGGGCLIYLFAAE